MTESLAAYIRADKLMRNSRAHGRHRKELFRNRHHLGLSGVGSEDAHGLQPAHGFGSCRMLPRWRRDHVSVNYSFNVIDERPETIRQTVAYHRELETIFGADLVEPAIFFIGLQPHTHLEQYDSTRG